MKNDVTATPATTSVTVDRPPTLRPRSVSGAHRQHGSDEGSHREKRARAGVLGEGDRGTEAGAGGHPEQERIGQGISKDALIGRTGQCQSGADQRSQNHPGKPDLPQDVGL